MPTGELTFLCHAEGCDAKVRERDLMCRKHWLMLPLSVQRRLVKHYSVREDRAGRLNDKFLEAYRDAVNIVALKEGREAPYSHV